MSFSNPYANLLAGKAPLEVLAATAGEIGICLSAIGLERVCLPPAPGKWSAVEIVCHLADCEVAFGFRLRQVLAEDNPTIQPFNQDKWAKRYHGISSHDALEAFKALRHWNLLMIKGALPAAAGRTTFHPERGPMTFQDVVELVAGHDLNHIIQLQKMESRDGAEQKEPPLRLFAG